jgi:hypothetical protein
VLCLVLVIASSFTEGKIVSNSHRENGVIKGRIKRRQSNQNGKKFEGNASLSAI